MGQGDETRVPEPIRPQRLSRAGIRYAPAVRAGRWVFATGHKGTDYINGMAPEVVAAGLPQQDKPKAKREAERLFANLSEVLRDAGSGLENVVRIDQYYTHHTVVDPYHEARKAAFGGRIPPSTSNLHQRFLLVDQEIEVQAIAIVPEPGFEVAHTTIDAYKVHPTSGYSHALTVGDFVFVAGQTAEARRGDEGPIDPKARMPVGHLWKGTPIKLETEFILKYKLEPALHAVGSSLNDVVKAQVYMRDVSDFGAFNEVWASAFQNAPPATSLITTSTPGFIVADERIEINTIALRNGGATAKQIVKLDIPTAFSHQSVAVRAGDLLFLSGLYAIDNNGLIPEARIDYRQPFFGSTIEAEMEKILEYADEICYAAGTSLKNVVRIQQFHADLSEFHTAYRVWERHLPGHHLPFSAIEIPSPLPVPGASVMIDLWVWAPL